MGGILSERRKEKVEIAFFCSLLIANDRLTQQFIIDVIVQSKKTTTFVHAKSKY
jgi:hypothetical protein